MPSHSSEATNLLQTLAQFRFELRRFLHFSERAALDAGLQPQQHQLLLQIAGASPDATVTIAYVADRLGLKHNSTVELVDRSESEGLLARSVDPSDRRRAILSLSNRGKRLLDQLSGEHVRELNEWAPRLGAALDRIKTHAPANVQEEA